MDTSTWSHQGFPAVRSQVATHGQQKNLDSSTGAGLHSLKARRQHATLISHQKIAWTQVRANVAKYSIFQLTGIAMNDQKSGTVSGLQGCLGNALRRQMIIEIRDVHMLHCSASAPAGADARQAAS